MRLTRRLAKKMLHAEREAWQTQTPLRHASGRRYQARVLLDPSPANRAYFESANRWTLP